MTKRTLIVGVLVLVLAVAAAVGITAYVVGPGTDGGWSAHDEKTVLDDLRSPGKDRETDNEAACVLEVYEKYFPNYDDYYKASDDSPTLLKANAAAARHCLR
jgi:hypothetical protein